MDDLLAGVLEEVSLCGLEGCSISSLWTILAARRNRNRTNNTHSTHHTTTTTNTNTPSSTLNEVSTCRSCALSRVLDVKSNLM
jgi:hypothetical protein